MNSGRDTEPGKWHLLSIVPNNVSPDLLVTTGFWCRVSPVRKWLQKGFVTCPQEHRCGGSSSSGKRSGLNVIFKDHIFLAFTICCCLKSFTCITSFRLHNNPKRCYYSSFYRGGKWDAERVSGRAWWNLLCPFVFLNRTYIKLVPNNWISI